MRGFVAAMALLALASCGGCSHHPPPGPGPVDSGVERSVPDDTVKPNYDPRAAVDPLADKLCHALAGLAIERAGACCHQNPGINLAPLCSNALSSAMGSGALVVDAKQADACIAAVDAQLQGCDWVGAPPPPPAACTSNLMHGTLAEGQRCRSSLECQGQLRCRGAGPTDIGVCRPPQAPGGPCNTAVDALAPFLNLSLDADRPECDGYCIEHRCRASIPAGGSCKRSLECARGLLCVSGTCTSASPGKLNEACVAGVCERGLRCLAGTCHTPTAPGATCTNNLDCAGRCVAADAGAPRCEMACDTGFHFTPAKR